MSGIIPLCSRNQLVKALKKISPKADPVAEELRKVKQTIGILAKMMELLVWQAIELQEELDTHD